MNYIVIFDARNSGYSSFWPILIGLPFIASGVLIAIWYARSKRTGTSLASLVLSLFAAMLVVVSVMIIGFSKYRLVAALKSGRCDVTEGIVTDFTPVEPDGRGGESFVVGGRRFHYSDYELRPGFHQTQRHGGPLHEGLHVRIYHLEDEIARLEIAK